MAPRPGTNGGNAEAYLGRIEHIFEDLDRLRADYKHECKARREDIRDLYMEARSQGVEVKALKGLVKFRMLARKQQHISDAFDEIEQAAYEDLIDRLGDLGRAAAERAGVLHSRDEGEEAPLR